MSDTDKCRADFEASGLSNDTPLVPWYVWQAAYAAGQAAAAPPEWKPIESAPDNGNCLVWVETDDGGEIHKLERDDRGNWLHEGEPTFCHSYFFDPRFWMPLPPPPAAAPKGGA